MKESEASSGTKLYGLLVAFERGVALTTALNWLDCPAAKEWDDVAEKLLKNALAAGSLPGPPTSAFRPESSSRERRN